MNIDKIKNDLNDKINKKIHFIYNGSRNQIEEFSGKIVGIYNYVFVIELDNNYVRKSFSYTDVLIGNLVLCKNM